MLRCRIDFKATQSKSLGSNRQKVQVKPISSQINSQIKRWLPNNSLKRMSKSRCKRLQSTNNLKRKISRFASHPKLNNNMLFRILEFSGW